MNKAIEVNEAIKIAKKLKSQSKTIVVAGGFFDILHLGHIKFLKKAKKHGDFLFILLEDDVKAKQVKGIDRPINPQKDRASILETLSSVDYIIMLRNMTKDSCYDKIIIQIAPDIIATTNPDPYINHKERQAKLVNGKTVYVIQRISNYSTTKLSKKIK